MSVARPGKYLDHLAPWLTNRSTSPTMARQTAAYACLRNCRPAPWSALTQVHETRPQIIWHPGLDAGGVVECDDQ